MTTEEQPNGLSRRSFLGAAGAAAVGVVGSAAISSSGPASAATRNAVTIKPAGQTSTTVKPAATPALTTTPVAPIDGKAILVLLTLYGGNDGLDTVVPYSNSAYLSARGALAFQANQVLQLDSELGLNAKLAGLKTLWDRKRVAIVRGVGYPNPNRSHFRSMDIWQTAVPETTEVSGWLGRWHDATGPDPIRMVSIGAAVPRFMVGFKGGATALPSGQLALPGGTALANAFGQLHRPGAGADLGQWGARLGAVGADLLRVQSQLGAILNGGVEADGSSSLEGGATANGDTLTELDKQFDEVSRLINGGAPTRVFGVSLGGFDTHATEREKHDNLLGAVDRSVSRFMSAMEASPNGQNVVLMIYSEFGRRVSANLTDGTDHGTAAPVFVIGPKVKGGFYGDSPSMSDLDQGDLKYTTDFRSIYATLLGTGLGFDPAVILRKAFTPVPFL